MYLSFHYEEEAPAGGTQPLMDSLVILLYSWRLKAVVLWSNIFTPVPIILVIIILINSFVYEILLTCGEFSG